MRNLMSDVTRILSEANLSIKANCPNATAVMCRKAVETFIGARGAKKAAWRARLQLLYDKGKLDRRLFNVALHVREVGNRAAHTRHGVPMPDAQDCWELTKIFAHLAGIPLDSGWGPLASLDWDEDPLKKVRRSVPWRRPLPISRDHAFPVWLEGGLVNVLFRCRRCGTPIEVEFLEVPEPWFGAESAHDSRTFNTEISECPTCYATHEVTADNTLMGWDIDILPWTDGKKIRKRRPPHPDDGIAPPKGKFRFKIVENYAEWEEPPDLPGQ